MARPEMVRRAAAIALALGAAALLAIHLDATAFFDNEGRYAEVAREMVLSGDWVTPRLDFTLFLNKPPLTYWLVALAFETIGVSEWARLVSIAAAAVTLWATCRIGAALHGERTGLLAGAVLASSLGFALEARTLRPDMLIAASTAVAVLCWLRAEASPGRRVWWLGGLYAALGLGMLAKGLVSPAVASLPIVAVTLRQHGWRGLGRLRLGLGLAVLAAIVLPWHVAVALRHPGFAWDYVVNQHLLFALDRKLPRDSEGDTLGFFWAAFAGRFLPWSILLPLVVREVGRGLRSPSDGTAVLASAAWVAGPLLLFSVTPSRLEHYSIPALPAAALLVALTLERARTRGLPAWGWHCLLVVSGGVVLAAAVALVWGPAWLAETWWLTQVPVLLDLVRPAAVVALAAGIGLVLAARRRRPGLGAAVLLASTGPLVAIVLRAEMLAEPIFSWRPAAHAVVAAVPPDVEIVFESPEEYQLVGGLAYYTRRRITLLEPPGFVPPTYLEPETASMFLAREAFDRRWRAGEPLALVSDPQRRRDDPAGLVPGPFHVVGRFGDRWVLTSFAPSVR